MIGACVQSVGYSRRNSREARMRRLVLVFFSGGAVGAAVVFCLLHNEELAMPREAVAPVALSCDEQMKPLRDQLAKVEGSKRTQEMDQLHVSGQVSNSSMADEEAADETSVSEAMKWRVSAIEKFIPLSEDQKTRLKEKFVLESQSEKGEVTTESLDDILGAEQASYYRQQVQAAFKRVQDQETEREVVWLSRQLSLSIEQERAVREVLARVEQQVASEALNHNTARSPQDRVKRMIEENRKRSELRNNDLKTILSPEQYQAYIKSQSESASSDIEVFHDPGS